MMKTLTTSIAALAFTMVAASASFADDKNVEITGSYVYQTATLNNVTAEGSGGFLGLGKQGAKLTVNTIKDAKIQNSTVSQYANLYNVHVKKGGHVEVNAIGE